MKLSKRLISILLSALFICALTTTVALAETEIEAIAVDNVPVPVDGNKPVYSVRVASPSYGLVDYDEGDWLNGISWSEYDADWEYIKEMTPDSTFTKGNYYVCFAKLQASSGYAFTNNATVVFNGSVNGNIQDISNDGSTATAYAAFLAVDSIKEIELTVVRPVIGKTPTFAKVDTDQFESKNSDPKPSNQTNGVVWTNEETAVNLTVSNPFKADTTYSVTYTIFAKEGYGFASDITAKINGKEAEVNKTADYITVKLTGLKPNNGEKEIEELDLTVQAPIEGEKPAYDKIETEEYLSENDTSSANVYSNGIGWYKTAYSTFIPGGADTFEADKEYTVKILLTAKDGYMFSEIVTAKINGVEATVDAFDEFNIIVEAPLTAAKKHIHSDDEWKTDEKDHWKECSECKEITANKEAHKDENNDNICDVCSYKLPSKGDDSNKQEPTPDNTVVEKKAAKPAKVKGVKLTAGKKKLTVKWNKAKNAKKYRVKYSYKKNMKKAKFKTVKKNKVVIKKLKSGKKVYIQVQGVNGKVKGKFSKKASKKIK